MDPATTELLRIGSLGGQANSKKKILPSGHSSHTAWTLRRYTTLALELNLLAAPLCPLSVGSYRYQLERGTYADSWHLDG
jgi:hypothetical protein